jgi:hypothetical protein
MDPITAAIGVAGLGLKLFGSVGTLDTTYSEAGLSSQETALSQQNTQLQIQENAQRQLAMQISSRRQATQDTRNAQMTAARNLAAGVSQTGGTSSSGVTAGQQGATSGGAYNLQGINQNLQIGNTLFGLQGQQSQNQIQMAGLQGQMNTLQGQASIFGGIGSLGGSLANSAGPLGNILGNFFGNKNDPSASNPISNTMNASGGSVGGA